MKQRRWRRSEGRDLSLIHTVEQEKQDMMSNKMDARIKDGAMTEKEWLLWFRSVFPFWILVLVPGRSRKLNGISWVDVAVVA